MIDNARMSLQSQRPMAVWHVWAGDLYAQGPGPDVDNHRLKAQGPRPVDSTIPVWRCAPCSRPLGVACTRWDVSERPSLFLATHRRIVWDHAQTSFFIHLFALALSRTTTCPLSPLTNVNLSSSPLDDQSRSAP